MGEELDAVTRRDGESDATADARLFAGPHVIDRIAVFRHALFERIQIGVFAHLEAIRSISGRVGAAQDDAVMIEFIGGLQINPAVLPFGHLMQADALGVVFDRSRHIEHA